MSWIDDILERCPSHFNINDSKTPSGSAHVGSLRGVLIHDALARAAQHRGMQVRFSYGCDDMDPVDEIPHGTGDHFKRHLGKPLVHAPAPRGYDADNMADAYFSEFTATFEPLGVAPDFYSMSDLYRSGRLDNAIDEFLRHAPDVRRIYARESGALRDDRWLPFQPICENCGRIGTTFASDYDGETVAYECRPDLVEWADGCASKGRVIPFGGNGKLPWKLEWAAKWQILEVGLEGSGKDHMSASGSYSVTSALAREVLRGPVPQVFAYEFFTVGGAKMSSSRGLGVSAGDITEMLPAELLRYLVLRTQPRRAIDFDLDLATLTKAFTEYERLWRSVEGEDATDKQRQLFAVSSSLPFSSWWPAPDASAHRESELLRTIEVLAGQLAAPEFSPPFDSVVSVAMQPHIDLAAHVASLGVGPLSENDRAWLDVKARTAASWSARYSDAAQRLKVVEDFLPDVQVLGNQQRAFLAVCAKLLAPLDRWAAADIQATMFDAARIVGVAAGSAFEALYTAFFGWPEGPRAGTFLEFAGRDETIRRLSQVEFSYRELLDETTSSQAEWEQALQDAWAASQALSVLAIPLDDEPDTASATSAAPRAGGAVELFVVDDRQRTTALRTRLLTNQEIAAVSTDDAAEAFEASVLAHVAQVLGIAASDVPVSPVNPFARG